MIIVLVNIAVKEGMAGEFIAAANKCVEATRREEDNISYTVYTEAADTLRFVIVEEWASQAALDAHMQTIHFAEFGAQIKDLLAGPRNIKVYEANKLQ